MANSPANRFDQALKLKGIVTSLATGKIIEDEEYRYLRTYFLSDSMTAKLLPAFIRSNLESDGLWAHFKGIHTGSGAYATRRNQIDSDFLPLLNYLSQKGLPADECVSGSLTSYDADGVTEAWEKALARRKSDPEGAITAARTLLEEVCKHILEDGGEDGFDKWDLPKLYSQTTKLMNLAPSQHTEDSFKRILGGCQSIVETLGELRNKISDAHGGGRNKVRPSERHAMLAVNLSGSMAAFMVDTWAIARKKKEIEKAQALTPTSGIAYRGVSLSSRYDIDSEIDTMRCIVQAVPLALAQRLESIWCDSKAGACYSIKVRHGKWHPDIQHFLGAAAAGAGGGHNGIYIEADGGNGCTVDPYWPGDVINDATD